MMKFEEMVKIYEEKFALTDVPERDSEESLIAFAEFVEIRDEMFRLYPVEANKYVDKRIKEMFANLKAKYAEQICPE